MDRGSKADSGLSDPRIIISARAADPWCCGRHERILLVPKSQCEKETAKKNEKRKWIVELAGIHCLIKKLESVHLHADM
ncbi:hypothetical protein SUGI_0314590 [Cryptomeria japonica]|nr:hypothetical protein SUGI_0314590 [Cryptomeria japonica]